MFALLCYAAMDLFYFYGRSVMPKALKGWRILSEERLSLLGQIVPEMPLMPTILSAECETINTGDGIYAECEKPQTKRLKKTVYQFQQEFMLLLHILQHRSLHISPTISD